MLCLNSFSSRLRIKVSRVIHTLLPLKVDFHLLQVLGCSNKSHKIHHHYFNKMKLNFECHLQNLHLEINSCLCPHCITYLIEILNKLLTITSLFMNIPLLQLALSQEIEKLLRQRPPQVLLLTKTRELLLVNLPYEGEKMKSEKFI